MKDTLVALNESILQDYLQQVKQKSLFSRTVVGLHEQQDWAVRQGALSHQSGGFFHVVGAKRRTNPQEEYLMLYQPQGAVTGLILCKTAEEPMVLLQARVEPGNSYIVQYGPTIQSTAANYLRMHGGKATSLSEYFLSHHPQAQLITHSMQQDLGKRYFQKSKTHHYIEVPELLPTPDCMIWVPLSVLRGAISTSNFLNADLRSLLSVFDWDAWLGHTAALELHTVWQPLPVPVHGVSAVSPYRMCGLHELQQWEVSEAGVLPRQPHRPGVQFFSFASTTREVTQWVQPLMTVQGVGLVQQLIRRTDSGVEWLLRLSKEAGTSTAFVYDASYTRYPEETTDDNAAFDAGKVTYSMVQCDEGGRFMENDTQYDIREVSAAWNDIEPTHCWVPTRLLKTLLAGSNMCSFQLRNVASMLLAELCPNTFGGNKKATEP